MAAITTAAIVAAGAIGSAVVQANAAKKAAAAQQEALKNVKGVDINQVSQQAKDADIAKYRDQFNLLNQYDPVTGEIRSTTNDQLADFAKNDSNSNDANSILKTLFNENANPDSTDVNFYNTLRSQAQNQLDQGGQLSPEQQAEFVRAGLEGASTTGLNAGSAATRQSVGKLLASEQLQQQQQRQQMAQQLFGFATELKNNRNQTLGNIANQNLAASQVKQNKLLALSELADSRVPDVGLSGGDIANLAVGNQNQANQVALQRGAIQAQQAQARGQITAGLIGGLTSAAGMYAGGGYGSMPSTNGGLTAMQQRNRANQLAFYGSN